MIESESSDSIPHKWQFNAVGKKVGRNILNHSKTVLINTIKQHGKFL